MKRKLLSMLLVIVLLALLTSCGCKHEWKNATCTEPQTCIKCGGKKGNALGHKYGEEVTIKEPTCTEAGVKEATCTACGDEKTTEIPMTAHSWTTLITTKKATCTEEGLGYYKCSICGETKYETLKKLNHQYKDGYCKNCFAEDPSGINFSPSEEDKGKIDKIKTIWDREIKSEGDFYYLLFSFSDEEGNTVIAPCVLEMRIVNDEDETVYKAKRIVTTSIWSNDFSKWILASPIMRSDIKEGSSSWGTLYFTVRFVDTYFKEYGLGISNLPVHSFAKEEIVSQATCGSNGMVRKTCSSCGEIVTEKTPATGNHIYRKGTVAVEPTCHTEGLIEFHCAVCGYVRTEKIEKLEHVFENDKCTDCGTLKIGSKGPAGGYIFYDCDLDNEDGNWDGLISSECGWRFLEAAPEDIGEAVFGYYRTSPNGKNLYVNGDVHYYEETCTRQGIGYGKSNTEMLVDAMGSEAYVESSGSETTEKYAAKMCADYSVNGYDDWFLPSKDELNLMYTNLEKNGIGNFGDDGLWWSIYWSSSEGIGYSAWEQVIDPEKSALEYGSGYSAWEQDFYDGYQLYDGRGYGYYYVRPVRAFL